MRVEDVFLGGFFRIVQYLEIFIYYQFLWGMYCMIKGKKKYEN